MTTTDTLLETVTIESRYDDPTSIGSRQIQLFEFFLQAELGGVFELEEVKVGNRLVGRALTVPVEVFEEFFAIDPVCGLPRAARDIVAVAISKTVEGGGEGVRTSLIRAAQLHRERVMGSSVDYKEFEAEAFARLEWRSGLAADPEACKIFGFGLGFLDEKVPGQGVIRELATNGRYRIESWLAATLADLVI